MKLLLVLCTGNTCRSPMGKLLLEERIRELGKQEEYRVESAGLMAGHAYPASENSELAMEELGLDLSGHRSATVTMDQLVEAHRIFVMTEQHRKTLADAIPLIEPKIEVMNVPDPYGQDLTAYRKCRDAMRDYFEGTVL